MTWQDSAACKGRKDIDFFPTMDRPGGQNARWRANVARAKAVCAECPVIKDCRIEAQSHDMTAGIWFGTTEAERKGLPRIISRPHVARCGTDSGYRRHRRWGEDPCPECRFAHAIAHRVRKIGMAS
jgi:WhiB family transcriptional regulator, redox-sensing transcriptional regulator